MRIWLSVLLILVSSTAAFGDWTVAAYRTFRTDKDQWDLARIYVRGIGTGYSLVNARLKSERSRQLFCPPARLAPIDDDYVSILDSEIASQSQRGTPVEDSYIETLLLDGLMRTFPCPKLKQKPIRN